MRKIFFLMIAVIVIVGNVFGANYYQSLYFGMEQNSNSGELLGIGGTNYAVPMLEMVSFNPALINVKNYKIMVNGVINGLDEVRRIPAYDGFDAVYNYSAYAGNTNYFANLSVVAGINLEQFISFDSKLAIGYAPAIDFNYSYKHDHHKNDGSEELEATTTIDNSGTINALSVGLSANIMELFDFGLTYQYLSGDISNESKIHYYDNDTDVSKKNDYSLSGNRIIIGISKKLFNRYLLGFSYRTQYTLSGDGTYLEGAIATPFNIDMDYPAKMAFSTTFYPRNVFVNYFSISVDYQNYESVGKIKKVSSDSTLVDVTDYKDVIGITLGIEHTFGHSVPLRIGFRSENSYLDKSMVNNSFFVGTTINLMTNLSLDLAGSFGKTNYRAYNQFNSDFPLSNADFQGKDNVEETNTNFTATLQYSF